MSDPKATAKRREAVATAAALAAVYAAARTDVLRRFEATGSIANLLTGAWADLLRRRVRERSEAVVLAVTPDVDLGRVAGKLDAYAEWFAREWEQSTRDALAAIDVLAADLEAEIRATMDQVVDTSHLRADSLSVEMGNFAVIEEATIAGRATKTWRTQGATTRPEHLALEGQTVPIASVFGNGLQYPGAPGPPEQRVNCDCYLTFGG